ncbi:MAG: cytochrome c family protein [Fimbriimonadaceae bacterium]|nr:hypothetical protein [Chthonomonadaceae bacterium]MCO5296227.1 cytochrome c family protein [Fimbriimonadaceae bacterium]
MLESPRATRKGKANSWLLAIVSGGLLTLGFGSVSSHRPDPPAAPQILGDKLVIAYNDLGMHCLNDDFSEICILPPYNTMRATVIDRSNEDPKILTTGVTVEYSIPGNTVSHTKTNFWDYAPALFGVALPLDVGLTGNGLTGSMTPTADRDWIASGIPITPITDQGANDPYQLARVQVRQNGQVKDVTYAVIPVSWEIHCDYCHRPQNGDTVAGDILRKHDRKHGTDLMNQKPVLCASCHADPALGTAGVPGVSSMSSAMHSSHAKRAMPYRMRSGPAKEACYNCHPGTQTQCLRDVHYARGMKCEDCHGNMKAVGSPLRTAWVDEPRCGSCHHVPGHEYEQPGKLFRDSVGHKNVKCVVCHNSPHAIVPTVTAQDNEQMLRVQGHVGTLDTCSACHSRAPDHPFFHRRES